MIDTDGYRLNVAIVLANGQGQVFLARRLDDNGWQFPQGGIDEGESSERAMFRELYEEIGLLPNQVSIVSRSDDWLRYDLPKNLQHKRGTFCLGQKQHWYLLHLKCDASEVDFNKTGTPEFDACRWVDYWHPVKEAVHFKRTVYKQGLNTLSGAHATLVRRLDYLNR